MKLSPLLSRINIWFLYFLFTGAVFGVVVYSIFLVKELRLRETKRIEIFAKAMQMLQSTASAEPGTQELLLAIITENDQLPVVITDKNKKPLLGEGTVRNVPAEISSDSLKFQKYILAMEQNYKPFEINIAGGNKQLVFYDNSPLLNNLQYFPYLVGLFILSYLIFSLWFLRTIKKTDEGFVWAGLAKETAHQIGTPLSSMIGWIEVMRLENPDSEGAKEIEKDIYRLKTISERFSKIGSVPELNDLNLNETIQINFDYLKNRISRKINFSLNMPSPEILVPHNRILMSWVIENLVKNAVDAMKGTGTLSIILTEKTDLIWIDIKDSGSGMTSSLAKKVFNPGYSTKKRGWGLGLSLAKRVIKEYHNGDVRIAHTEIGKGTTFRIILRNR